MKTGSSGYHKNVIPTQHWFLHQMGGRGVEGGGGGLMELYCDIMLNKGSLCIREYTLGACTWHKGL